MRHAAGRGLAVRWSDVRSRHPPRRPARRRDRIRCARPARLDHRTRDRRAALRCCRARPRSSRSPIGSGQRASWCSPSARRRRRSRPFAGHHFERWWHRRPPRRLGRPRSRAAERCLAPERPPEAAPASLICGRPPSAAGPSDERVRSLRPPRRRPAKGGRRRPIVVADCGAACAWRRVAAGRACRPLCCRRRRSAASG